MTAAGGYDASKFPPFAVTADTAVLTTRDNRLMVVLVKRGRDPYAGRWALPGGFVDIDEDLETAALRELEEETGIRCSKVEQLGAYGRPDRDPRMRVVTVVFWAYVAVLAEPRGGDDAVEARLWAVDDLMDHPDVLAFDHHEIIGDVVSAHVVDH